MKTHCESAKNQIGLPNTTIFDILFKISCRKRRSQLLSLDALFYARNAPKYVYSIPRIHSWILGTKMSRARAEPLVGV